MVNVNYNKNLTTTCRVLKNAGWGGGGTNPGMCMLSRVSNGYTCLVLISVLDSWMWCLFTEQNIGLEDFFHHLRFTIKVE